MKRRRRVTLEQVLQEHQPSLSFFCWCEHTYPEGSQMHWWADHSDHLADELRKAGLVK